MTRHGLAALLVGVVVQQCGAQALKPAFIVGDAPPPLALEGMMQTPSDVANAAELDWASLKGNVVVLEFWATWCGPCVAAIPHMNELVETFRAEPVRFIAVTDEEPEVVSEFLKKRKMRSWIGIDGDTSLFRALSVRGRPHVVIVGKDGRIAAVTSPTALDAAMIRRVLAGERMPQGKMEVIQAGVEGETTQPAPLYQVLIRPDTLTMGGVSRDEKGGKVSGRGLGAASLVRLAWPEWGAGLVVLPDDLPKERYSLTASMPPDRPQELRAALQSAVCSMFGLAARVETRPVEVLVLALPDGAAPNLKPGSQGMSSAGPGRFTMFDRDWKEIVELFGGAAGKPVVDRTGITGRFNADLRWDPSDSADMLRALKELSGVRTSIVVESREVLVLTKEQTVREGAGKGKQ